MAPRGHAPGCPAVAGPSPGRPAPRGCRGAGDPGAVSGARGGGPWRRCGAGGRTLDDGSLVRGSGSLACGMGPAIGRAGRRVRPHPAGAGSPTGCLISPISGWPDWCLRCALSESAAAAPAGRRLAELDALACVEGEPPWGRARPEPSVPTGGNARRAGNASHARGRMPCRRPTSCRQRTQHRPSTAASASTQRRQPSSPLAPGRRRPHGPRFALPPRPLPPRLLRSPARTRRHVSPVGGRPTAARPAPVPDWPRCADGDGPG